MADKDKKRKVGKHAPKKKLKDRGLKSTKERIKEFQEKRRYDAAEKFKEKVLDKYGDRVKAILAYGSGVRGEFHSESDMDVLVLVDDTKEKLTKKKRNEMKKTFKEMAEGCGKTKSGENIIHVQPPRTITEYWDMMRRGSPFAHSMTEDAVPVYDTGFFAPIQRLHKMGKLPATTHSAEKRMSKVPKRLRRAQRMKLAIVGKDIYNAMTDALQAVLVYMGHSPPAPKHLADKAREHLVENDLIDEKYVEDYEKIYSIYKDIEHKEISEIEGEKLDEYIEVGREFAKEMQKALKKIELNRKARGIQKNYEVMVKTSVAALKALDELPEDPKKLPKAFKQKLIDEELVNPRYEDVFGKVLEMKKKLNDKDIQDISEHEVNVTRNHVQGFVREVRDMLSDKGIEPGELKEDLETQKKKLAKAEAKKSKAGEEGAKELEGEKYECEECGKEFGSERGLKIHKGKVH